MNFRAAKFVLAGFLAISFAIPLFRLSVPASKKAKGAAYDTPVFSPALALFAKNPTDSTVRLDRTAWTENK